MNLLLTNLLFFYFTFLLLASSFLLNNNNNEKENNGEFDKLLKYKMRRYNEETKFSVTPSFVITHSSDSI